MNLVEKYQALAQAVGYDIKELIQTAGDLASLTTQDKENLVAGINELKAYADTFLDGLINDASMAPNATYSSTKIHQVLQAAIDIIKNGAPEAFDSLKEIADWISSDQTQTSNILATVEKLLRFDAEMALSEVQKTNVQTTLSLAIAQIGISDIYAGLQPKKYKDIEFYVPHSLGGRIFQIIGDDVNQVASADTSQRAPYPPNQFISSEFSHDGSLFLSREGYYSGFPRTRLVIHKRNENGTFTESAYIDNYTGEDMYVSRKHTGVIYVRQNNFIANFALRLSATGAAGEDRVQANFIGKMAESKTGKLALARTDGIVRIFDVTAGNPMSFAQVGEQSIAGGFALATCNSSIAFSPDGRILAAAQHHGDSKRLAFMATTNGDFNQHALFTYTIGVGLQPRLFWVDTNTLVVQQGNNLLFYRIAYDGISLTATLVKTLAIMAGQIIDGVTEDGRHIFMRTLAGGMRVLRHVGEYQYDTLANITTGPTTLEQSHTISRALED